MNDVRSFRELRGAGLYEDRTMLIADMMRLDPCGAFLYTRPPGTGKTVSVSMLDAFYNRRLADDAPSLFEGLDVSRFPQCMEYMSGYDVVRLDLDGLWADYPTYGDFLDAMRGAFARACAPFEETMLRDNYAGTAERVRKILEGEIPEANTHTVFRDLVRTLNRSAGRMPVVLVDGLDRPVAGISDREVRDSAVRFMGAFCKATFKDEPFYMAYVTGTVRADQCCETDVYCDLHNDSVVSDTRGRFGRISGGSEEQYDGVAARMLRESDPSYRDSLGELIGSGTGNASFKRNLLCENLRGGDWSSLQTLLVHTGCLILEGEGEQKTVRVPDEHARDRLRSILRMACQEKQEV